MFMDILEKSANCDEIMFFEDGSWRPASEIEGKAFLVLLRIAGHVLLFNDFIF